MAECTSSPGAATAGSGYQTQSESSTGPDRGSNGGFVGTVKERATAQLSSQKDKATDGLGSVATAVRQTTQSLREQNHDTVAQYIEQAADGLERFSERLKQKDVGELLNDVQQLARRQPALFIGGAFAVGLAGARFLKSSSERSHEYASGDHRDEGREMRGGAYSTTPGTVGARSGAGSYTGGRTGYAASTTRGGRSSETPSAAVGSSFESAREGRSTERTR